MADISARLVKELREKTGVGFMECKKALREANGDVEQAEVILRKRGIQVARQKAGRAAKEGIVATYIHPGSKLGAMVEVNCESDFVARTDDFGEMVHDIAMHVAATDPRYIRKEDVDEDAIAKEREIQRARALEDGKPEAVVDKIVDGRLKKFYEEVCLRGGAHQRQGRQARREHSCQPDNAIQGGRRRSVDPRFPRCRALTTLFRKHVYFSVCL